MKRGSYKERDFINSNNIYALVTHAILENTTIGMCVRKERTRQATRH